MLKAHLLCKHFGAHKALDNLNLEVKPGEVFCLLGGNGAGKTTTINLFLGFLKPTSGGAYVGEVEVAHEPREARAQLAYIPEQVSLYPELSGLDNLAYFLKLGGQRLAVEQLRGALTEAGLQAEAHLLPVSGYSKGMGQKVGIALALARGARALLLDEPTSGLDPAAANDFVRSVAALAEQGTAILMVTHDIFRAKESGHRVGIMRRGSLVDVIETGSVDHARLESIYLEHMKN